VNATAASSDVTYPFLSGGGEMGALIRAHDWAATPFGGPGTWPESLRWALALCLHSSFPNAIYWGPELRLLYNDAWAPIPADRHPWALGRPGAEVWADIWDVVGPQFEQVLATGRGYAAFDQILWMERNGVPQETYWNYSFSPIFGDDGAVLGILNQGHETTSRVVAERIRAEEAERQRQLFEQAPGFITALRGPEHRFEFVNHAYRRLFGERDFIGRTAREVFPELPGQGFFEQLETVYRTGERFSAHRMPAEIVLPSGETQLRYLDFIYEPVKDEGGRVTGIFCEGHDATAEHVAEQQLQAQTRALELLNRVAAATIVERELDRIVQIITDAGVELSGAQFGAFFYNVVDQTGESYMLYSLSGVSREAFAGFPMPRNTDVFAHTFGGHGTVVSDDITADPRYGRNAPHQGMPDGHLPVVSYLAVPVAARSGEVIGGLFFGHPEAGRFEERHARFIEGLASQAAIAIENARLIRSVEEARETLEERVAERTRELTVAHDALRQAQKMEAVGQLTGGIAHDFNNLLGAVVGSFDLIRRAPDNVERVKRYAEAGLQAAERGAKLTAQLLAFSRNQRIELKPVDPAALIEGMRDLLARTLGPAVRLSIEGHGVPAVLTDPTQLEMAVLNLAINARDAMPKGGDLRVGTRAIAISGDVELADGAYVALSVADTGTGMSPDVAARAFDPFFTTKSVGQGTGLGLSQVYGIAHQTGGTVRIDSEVGRGTTVTLLLPVTDRGTERGSDAAAHQTPSALQSATVLVIDDDDDLRGVLTESLRSLGYQVREADGGEAGLAAIDETAPDLVIVDFAMPGMNGAEVARAVRRRHPDLPIVFCTGYADTDAIEAAAGRDAPVLRKPFRVEELRAIVSQALAAARGAATAG
jgi:signal transduction histidine kinase/ActR/RegA family two-component response regulator/PAS domain-containing protein